MLLMLEIPGTGALCPSGVISPILSASLPLQPLSTNFSISWFKPSTDPRILGDGGLSDEVGMVIAGDRAVTEPE